MNAELSRQWIASFASQRRPSVPPPSGSEIRYRRPRPTAQEDAVVHDIAGNGRSR